MSRMDMMAPMTTTPAIFRTAASMWSGRSGAAALLSEDMAGAPSLTTPASLGTGLGSDPASAAGTFPTAFRPVATVASHAYYRTHDRVKLDQRRPHAPGRLTGRRDARVGTEIGLARRESPHQGRTH